MDIKLIALDMDGTLLDDNKELPPGFIDWVRNHDDIKTVIASGRQYYTLQNNMEPVKEQIIYVAENGGLVFEHGEVIYSNGISASDIEYCMEKISKIPEMSPLTCGIDGAYIQKGTRADVIEQADIYYHKLRHCDDVLKESIGDTLVKIAIYVDDRRAEEAMKYFEDLPEHLSVVLSGDSWIDIANKSVNKGSAIEAIQNKYGISRGESMAFGDYLNDMELLKSCEESYCMENGHERLKTIAKHIAPPNTEYGVMQVIENIIGK